jgi:gamma-glutamyltranspeptidase/glutathione hydrolase
MAKKKIIGKNGAIGSGRAGSEEAGIKMLKAGGNAIDAGVASVFALSVTDHDQFCFGGEVPMLIYSTKQKKVVAISGMGVAPKKASLDMFIGMSTIPGDGILPAAVPSALATCLLALDKFGTMSFADVIEPTIRILEKGGQDWFPRLIKTIDRLIEAENSESSKGRSAGLEAVRKRFYEGDIADELVNWNQSQGGLFVKEDLANYRAKIEDPVHGNYRGYDVYKCGFWTQGPSMIQALNILEDYDFSTTNNKDPEYIHLVIEAIKLAFADRDAYYGDHDFVSALEEILLSKEYAEKRRALIDQNKASLKHLPGDPWKNRALGYVDFPTEVVGTAINDTTTCVASDQFGNMFVGTPSGWGSGLRPGSTGVVLGTRLQSFNLWEGHPNVIKPGKRPRITLTPTLVMKEGKPSMVISVAGGDQQDQTALQILLSVIEFGVSPQEAVDTIRFGTNHFIGSFRQTPVVPGSIVIEDSASDNTIKVLQDKGHNVQKTTVFPSQAVAIVWREDGSMEVGGDLNKERHLAVY